MQENKTNSIIFIKDAESNIIEEAIVIVKGNFNVSKMDKKTNLNKNTILKEAELIINNRIEENNLSFLNFKIQKLIQRNKFLKIINIILIIIGIILFLS